MGETEIVKIISSFNAKNSVSYVDIPINLLKRCTDYMKTPLSYIINLKIGYVITERLDQVKYAGSYLFR